MLMIPTLILVLAFSFDETKCIDCFAFNYKLLLFFVEDWFDWVGLTSRKAELK